MTALIPTPLIVFLFLFFVFWISAIFEIIWGCSSLSTWFRNFCKRENQAQEQSESSVDENVIHVNSVSLLAETTVEIPLGT